MPTSSEETREARLSELFLLSLISAADAADFEVAADAMTAEDLRARLLIELKLHRAEGQRLRYGIVAYVSLFEWLLHQSARGLVALEILPSAPDNPRVRLTQHGKEVVAAAPGDLRPALGFAVG